MLDKQGLAARAHHVQPLGSGEPAIPLRTGALGEDRRLRRKWLLVCLDYPGAPGATLKALYVACACVVVCV